MISYTNEEPFNNTFMCPYSDPFLLPLNDNSKTFSNSTSNSLCTRSIFSNDSPSIATVNLRSSLHHFLLRLLLEPPSWLPFSSLTLYPFTSFPDSHWNLSVLSIISINLAMQSMAPLLLQNEIQGSTKRDLDDLLCFSCFVFEHYHEYILY